MSNTFHDLCEALRATEETLLLELLNISPEELVDAFTDKIYDKQDILRFKLGLTDDAD